MRKCLMGWSILAALLLNFYTIMYIIGGWQLVIVLAISTVGALTFIAILVIAVDLITENC